MNNSFALGFVQVWCTVRVTVRCTDHTIKDYKVGH